jgi:hypothetical protein
MSLLLCKRERIALGGEPLTVGIGRARISRVLCPAAVALLDRASHVIARGSRRAKEEEESNEDEGECVKRADHGEAFEGLGRARCGWET